MISNLKKIAIIGSSPIQLFLALYLARNNNHITLFNSDSWLGGAWRRINTPFGPLSTHNNIILPLDSSESQYLHVICDAIRSFNIDSHVIKCNVDLNLAYQPTLKLEFDFDKLIACVIENRNIHLSSSCESIEIDRQTFLINKSIFDLCYLSKRFRAIAFSKDSNQILPVYTSNLSHHYIFVFSSLSNSISLFEYTESYSDFFDRASLKSLGQNKYCFTARLRRSKKHLSEEIIILEIKKDLFGIQPIPLFIKKNLYSDVIVSNIKIIESHYKPFIKIVDTDQFVCSFYNNFLAIKD